MIHVKREGWVATIRVEDFSALSRHDLDLASSLRDAVRDEADRDDIKVLVLCADGEDFSPALGSRQHASVPANAAWHAAFAASTGLYQNLAFCKKIVVTAVRGQCHDAGSMLVLCSDFTVCAEGSRFGSPFDLLPEANMVLAAMSLRLNRAKSWMLGGSALTARQAFEYGLVNRIEPAGDVEATALQMARAAARTPLDGIAMSKIQVEAHLDSLGVGTDFDSASFFAAAMRQGAA